MRSRLSISYGYYHTELIPLNSNKFDLIVGFPGRETLPLYTDVFVRRIVQLISTEGIRHPWRTFVDALADSQTILHMHNIVALYGDGSGEARQVTAREAGLHREGHPFGLALTECGAVDCKNRGDREHIVVKVKPENGQDKVRISCNACGWFSVWVYASKLSPWLEELDRRAHTTYYHTFPPPPQIAATFSTDPKSRTK